MTGKCYLCIDMELNRPPIYLYTDGAASGNPGPGGLGVVLRCAGREKEISEGYRLTTNNRMELLAVIKGLEAIRWDNAEVHVWSDSSYVVKAVNEGWLENWKRTGCLSGKKQRFRSFPNSRRITAWSACWNTLQAFPRNWINS